MKRDYTLLLAIAAGVMAAPMAVGNDYYLSVLVMAALNAMMTVGLVLLMGYAGQVSIGHAAFYGLGAYTSGILTARYGWPIPRAFLTALLLVGAVAYIVGRPALKLKGHYLAMATLAFGEIFHIIFNEMDGLTGGPSGLSGIPRLKVLRLAFNSDRDYYYLTWGCLLTVLLLSINIIHSRVGRGMRAIHGSERAALAMGVDVAAYKTAVFVISAVYAAAAGALYAHFITFISPGSFSIGFSVMLVTMAAVGGMETIWGGVLGAVILTLLPEYLRFFQDYDILIYGAILLLIMIFMPRGLAVGLPDALAAGWQRWRRKHAAP